MKQEITEINITPIKPTNGLVAFASFVLDNKLYLGSIGIMTRPNGGFRLIYPTRKIGARDLNVFYPISKETGQEIETAIINHFEKVVKIKDYVGHDNNATNK